MSSNLQPSLKNEVRSVESPPHKPEAKVIIKRFVIILLPLLCLLAVVSAVVYTEKVNKEQLILQGQESQGIEQQQYAITNIFKSITTDVMVLASHHDLQQMLAGATGDHKRALAGEFLAFSSHKGIYDQVRFLDSTGMETVRVNFNKGKPDIVPRERLQSKGKRYYFTDVYALNKGEIFVSPFDLNMEKGKIELPLKPMIRIGMPVFDDLGNKRGIVLLNYLGTELIQNIEQVAAGSSGQIMLLNADGYWLKGASHEDEWGFMYPDRKERTIGNRFPEAWSRISTTDSGQFINENGLFTYTTIRPLAEGLKSSTGSTEAFAQSADGVEAEEYYWKLISHVSTPQLNAKSREFLKGLVIIDGLLVVLFIFGAWLLARAQASSRQMQLHLKKMAARDGLTNLYNRVYFNGRLDVELQRATRFKSPLSLAMLDIDFFKSINDTFGHQAGDTCLVALADLMQSCSRKIDICARYGGEEFIIILPETPIDSAMIFAERLRQKVEELVVQHEDQTIQYTVSIGISSLNLAEETTPEVLVKAADSALYEAKESGRNRVISNPES